MPDAKPAANPYGVRNMLAEMQPFLSNYKWKSADGKQRIDGALAWSVLFAMSRYTYGDRGQCYASRKTLRADCGVSPETIKRVQDAAVKMDLIALVGTKLIGRNYYPIYELSTEQLKTFKWVSEDPNSSNVEQVEAAVKDEEGNSFAVEDLQGTDGRE
ncbi:MAG: hypothetical protein WCC04_21735 [Terriglobales bacterium]